MQRVALQGRHLLSLSPSRFVSSHHMSTDAQAAIARLRDSGLLKSKGLVGGKWVESYDGKTIQVQNPATGDVIANVPCMGKRETDDAISSAYNTFYCMNCNPLLIHSLDLNSCRLPKSKFPANDHSGAFISKLSIWKENCFIPNFFRKDRQSP